LTALIEDPHVKSVDKEKLRGYMYVWKWRDSKMLLGCALFHDIFKPCAILSKMLQQDEICVVGAIESLLKEES
jgi:tRNA(Ile2) C34 agmatinyltransferase TiaS